MTAINDFVFSARLNFLFALPAMEASKTRNRRELEEVKFLDFVGLAASNSSTRGKELLQVTLILRYGWINFIRPGRDSALEVDEAAWETSLLQSRNRLRAAHPPFAVHDCFA